MLEVRVVEGKEVVQEAASVSEPSDYGLSAGLKVWLELLEEKAIFIPSEEKVGNERGWRDAHGDATHLPNEHWPKLNVRGGEEGGEDVEEVLR